MGNLSREATRSASTPGAVASTADSSALCRRYTSVRSATEALAARLSAEDQGLQSMPACSPVKWHRAHTTWFWEAFVLLPRGVAPFHPQYARLFNSYYEALGPRHERPKRGLLSRPNVDEIAAYRQAIDAHMMQLITRADAAELARLRPLVELGLAHEEQHQELILTDLLHAFARNPLRPAYAERTSPAPPASLPARRWVAFSGGLVEAGAEPGSEFRFDNEEPRHRIYLRPFELADRLLTVGEWKQFVRAGGYREASWWLSDGWDWIKREGIEAPGHARLEGDTLVVFGLTGERAAHDSEPICHVSFYEADALARFFGARLPTEAEWEHAAGTVPVVGNFVESGILHALPRSLGDEPLAQLYGDAWEWTQSPYVAYPGYQPAAGALGEYNGKFMANQIVLRGGSCLTPGAHVRATYRNFWPADTQFQVAGVRLALDGRAS